MCLIVEPESKDQLDRSALEESERCSAIAFWPTSHQGSNEVSTQICYTCGLTWLSTDSSLTTH